MGIHNRLQVNTRYAQLVRAVEKSHHIHVPNFPVYLTGDKLSDGLHYKEKITMIERDRPMLRPYTSIRLRRVHASHRVNKVDYIR